MSKHSLISIHFHSSTHILIFIHFTSQNSSTSKYRIASHERNFVLVLFHYRTRMADYSENFRDKSPSKPCKICLFHTDSQGHSVRCAETLKKGKTVGKYDEIFTNNISKKTTIMLKEIQEYISEHLDEKK